jgi:hypothetical protein
MTPKEKSKDLINSFYYSLPNNGSETGLNSTTIRYKEAIQCALICVDEILVALNSDYIIYGSEYRYEVSVYYENVKSELQSL